MDLKNVIDPLRALVELVDQTLGFGGSEEGEEGHATDEGTFEAVWTDQQESGWRGSGAEGQEEWSDFKLESPALEEAWRDGAEAATREWEGLDLERDLEALYDNGVGEEAEEAAKRGEAREDAWMEAGLGLETPVEVEPLRKVVQEPTESLREISQDILSVLAQHSKLRSSEFAGYLRCVAVEGRLDPHPDPNAVHGGLDRRFVHARNSRPERSSSPPPPRNHSPSATRRRRPCLEEDATFSCGALLQAHLRASASRRKAPPGAKDDGREPSAARATESQRQLS